MQVNVNISLDETLLDGVNERLDTIMEAQTMVIAMLARIEQKQGLFAAMEEESNQFQEEQMSDVSERLAREMDSLEHLTTVTDGIVVWSQTVTTTLADVRAQLAARGVTDADLAQLDDVISATDAQTGKLAQVLTANTDAEDEEPVNPVPPVVSPGTPGTGDANDPSTAPDV